MKKESEALARYRKRRKGVGSLFLTGKIDDGVSGSRTCLAQTMIFMLIASPLVKASTCESLAVNG